MRRNHGCWGIGRWICVISLVWAGGGATFLMSGCDSEASAQVLSGFQEMSTALVDALFTAISNQLTSTESTTTDTSTTDTSSS